MPMNAQGRPSTPEVVEHIVQKTDGVPLFVEEMTKAVLGSSVLRADAERYTLTGPLSEISIPASLHESLMARLDRLPTLREVAQLGAVLGRDFAYEMLRAITSLDEPRLRDVLGRLVEAELLYQRGRPPRSRYMFKHALIQDAAYQSLLRRTRQQYHRQVAELFESNFVDTVETSPELVAHHYSEAGLPEQAVIYWQQAGERAVQRSANQEAIGHLTAGLAQMAHLPETVERAQQEFAAQRLLGQANWARVIMPMPPGVYGCSAFRTRHCGSPTRRLRSLIASSTTIPASVVSTGTAPFTPIGANGRSSRSAPR